jgi:hypothetical protein
MRSIKLLSSVIGSKPEMLAFRGRRRPAIIGAAPEGIEGGFPRAEKF